VEALGALLDEPGDRGRVRTTGAQPLGHDLGGTGHGGPEEVGAHREGVGMRKRAGGAGERQGEGVATVGMGADGPAR